MGHFTIHEAFWKNRFFSQLLCEVVRLAIVIFNLQILKPWGLEFLINFSH